MSNHKPECDAKWGYDQDHCICQWIELAEQRIIKLLEDEGVLNGAALSDNWSRAIIALIKGENR